MVCAVFWDVDVSPDCNSLALSEMEPTLKHTRTHQNCPLPTGFSGREVAQAIRKAVQEIALEDGEGNKIRDGNIISLQAYLEAFPRVLRQTWAYAPICRAAASA